MIHQNVTRLLHQAPKHRFAQYLILLNNKNHKPVDCYGRHFKRYVQSSAGKTISREENDDSSERNPRSLIAQRLFQSQQNGGFDHYKQNDRNNAKIKNDIRMRLEMGSISAEAIHVDEEAVNEIEKQLLESQTDEYIENVILKHDVHSQPKPSPLLGTEDRSVPASNVPCVGCGALLHCQHRTMPGFLPSERFKLLSESELRSSICQRCHYIQHCDAFVEVTSSAQDYAQIISEIRPTRSVVVMVMDVMDIPGSIVPHLATYIGHKHPLVIVGNKVDLVAPDSTHYLVTLKDAIMQSCSDAGLSNIRKVMLISAKTGYGIERLIDALFALYKMKVDVFIVGTANAGKSSLFNTLLASDYCRHRARDLIQRATVSVWPGTTLNLLKFPIMNPTPRTLARRHQRLKQEKALQKEAEKLERKQERKKQMEKHKAWELKELVSTTDTRSQKQMERDESDSPWGQDIFAYKGGRGRIMPLPATSDPSPWTPEKFDPATYKHSYWVHDTPGVINSEQTFNLLDSEECPVLQPVETMTPRCVVLKPGTAIFISGLARLDYVQGSDAMMTTVHCSSSIPLRVVSINEADQFYLQHAGTQELGIPIGDRKRLDRLPSLIGKEVTLEGGDNDKMAVADIQLSSIGWISMAPRPGLTVKVIAYTPARKGIHVRRPPLLPRFLQFKGKRIQGTPFFWPRRLGLPVIGRKLSNSDDNAPL